MERDYWQRVSFDAQVFTPQKIMALAESLADEGIATSRLLQHTGCTEASLRKASTRVSYRQLQAVYENACRLAKQPGIGLRAGTRLHLSATGIYGYALISSATGRQSSEFAMKYLPVSGPTCTYTMSVQEQEATWSCEPLFSVNPGDEMYRFCVELHLATTYTICLDMYGPQLKLKKVRLVYPPVHADLYRKVFRCPIQFNQPRNEMVGDAHWLDKPLVQANAFTHAMLLEMCDDVLEKCRTPHGVATRVRQALVMHPGRFALIDEMAEELGISVRTLRRRLDAEQTSYQTIVSDVRQHLAFRYLRETQLTNDEIAERLGYSDAANFRHAFKRWTGKKPGDFRIKTTVASSAGLGQTPHESDETR
jgi:AraC-like DNA-binding protein